MCIILAARSPITPDEREDPPAAFFSLPLRRKRIAPEIRCHVTRGRFTRRDTGEHVSIISRFYPFAEAFTRGTRRICLDRASSRRMIVAGADFRVTRGKSLHLSRDRSRFTHDRASVRVEVEPEAEPLRDEPDGPRYGVYLRSDTSSLTSQRADNPLTGVSTTNPVCGLTPHRREGHPSCLSNVGERFRVIANDRLCRTLVLSPFRLAADHHRQGFVRLTRSIVIACRDRSFLSPLNPQRSTSGK